jgi:hypothetical protein
MNNSSFSSLLKAHLMQLGKTKLTANPETFAWYQAQAPKPAKVLPTEPKPAPAPPLPKTVQIPPAPKLDAPKVARGGFALHPKKEIQTPVPKTLLEQLKESVAGVTFFEEPPLPKKVLLLCSEEERPLLEKLAQAIDQKLLSCTLSPTILENHLLIATKPTPGALYVLPPLDQLQELTVKQTVWKEIKACLSKYC